ncbi:MAG: GLPGLI family protein [Cyclobacteriaceae bacterium]
MKIFYTLLFSFLSITAFSQEKEGAVTYESVFKIDVSRFPENMRSMIPAERKSKYQLLFNQKEAIYKPVKEEEDINQEAGNGGGVRMRFRGGGGENSEYYTDLEKGITIDKQDFLDRTFLIDGGEEIEWKVTGEMQMIAGYQCMKATYMERDTILVAAWFTPQIPISLGPGQYAGLPGLVLSVDYNDGQRTLLATNIDLRALTEEETISPPEKGKKVSREEFNKMRREKMEEMREMNGGRGSGGTFIIRN